MANSASLLRTLSARHPVRPKHCVCWPDSLPQEKLRTLLQSGAAVLSYDAPVVTRVKPNGPQSGGTLLTMDGIQFAAADYTPTAFLSEAICATSSWQSATSVKCRSPDIQVLPGFAQLQTATFTGTGVNVFDFDSACITYVMVANAGHTGGIPVSITGANFGYADYTSTVSIGEAPCYSTSWTTKTNVFCSRSIFV